MARAVRAAVLVVLISVAASSWSAAVERELAGVRLGQRALDLLTKPGFGQPDFIGPLGALGGMAAAEGPAEEARQAAGAAGTAARRAGPTGPTAQRGGGRRGMGGGGMGGMRRAPASVRGASDAGVGSSLRVSLTAGMMGGGRGMRGGGGGARGGARGGAAGAGRAAGAARTRTTAAGAQDETAWMYWYYRRPGDVSLVLTLDRAGIVRAITLTGTFPYRAGRTSRGIGLNSTYMDIITQYGYPDQTAILGTALQLTYVDHGVRFQLEGMRVRQITIGSYVTAAAAEATPTPAPEAGPPPAGLSVEELRGYL